METPTISVLIPVHNVEPYVARCMDSIVRQTYPFLEIIVIDDGSTDATLSIVQAYASVDARIKVLETRQNLGIVGALNFGLSKVTGAYIARMDGDDVSALDRIERQIAFLQAHGDIDMVGVSVMSIDENDRILGRSEMDADWRSVNQKLKYGPAVIHGCWLGRRELFECLGGYRVMPGCEDYDFLLRAHAAGKRCTNVPGYYGYMIRLGRVGNTIHSMGLRQRKAKAYALKLYNERLGRGTDSYSQKALDEACSFGVSGSYAFGVSSRLLMTAALNKQKKFLRLLLLAASCMTYPPQLRYLYERYRVQKR